MSVSSNIRGAIQIRAATAVGFPPSNQQSYEGMLFTSTVNTPWVKLNFMPQSGRPFPVNAATTLHRGLFQITVYVPDGAGTNAAETAADAVCAVFRAGTHLSLNGEAVIIDYAERAPVLRDAGFVYAPVTIAWRCYSPNN